jgi:hypothetical protein
MDAFEAFLREIIDRFTGRNMKKTWVVELAGNTPPCKECLKLDGVTVDYNDKFPRPSMDLGPPLHPNCRCKITVKSSR